MSRIETPEWVADAIFYQIFPDRFAKSDRVPKPSNLEPWEGTCTHHGFKGGDLLGVVEHLDYLQDLGVTAIYFNPVFASTANHRYHTHDYYQVDPILGGNEALRTLLDEAHRRDMRIVLDGVFNHASRSFFQFSHIVENGPESPYLDWFTTRSFPLRPYHAPPGQHGYESWWNLPALPTFNVSTPAVRRFLWDVAAYWIEFGIDGWRLDVPAEIDDDTFWQEFRRRVKDTNPEAYIVGEIWGQAKRWLQGDQFDAVMNYLFARACLGFFVGDNLLQEEVARCGYHHIDLLDAEAFATTIRETLALYPRQVNQVQLNLLSSHDTPRFKTLARDDTSAYRLATLFQMTYPGAPCIYYGDEIGLTGTHDPGCRAGFPWDEATWDQGLRDDVRRYARLRHAHPALRRGDFAWLFAGQGIVVYLRRLDDKGLVVAINSSQHPIMLDVPVKEYLDDGVRLRAVDPPGDPASDLVVAQGRINGLWVPTRSGTILEIVGSGE
ncbi:MAG: glycoside hydrolase family 13 protein [Anaerolineae bacterium]|jgi:neopullulanase